MDESTTQSEETTAQAINHCLDYCARARRVGNPGQAQLYLGEAQAYGRAARRGYVSADERSLLAEELRMARRLLTERFGTGS